MNISSHPGSVEIFLKDVKGLIEAKMTCQSPSMFFPDQQFSQRALGHTELIAFKQKTLLDGVGTSLQISLYDLLELWVFSVEFLNRLKPKNFSIQD